MDDELERKLSILEMESEIKQTEEYLDCLRKQLKLLKNEK